MVIRKAKAGRPPSPSVGDVIDGKDGLLVWNGRCWRKLETWETPADFARWLDSTTWPRDTRATVPVPPGVIKRAIRDIRRLLEALEEARMTDTQRAMKAAGKRSLSSEMGKKNMGKDA